MEKVVLIFCINGVLTCNIKGSSANGFTFKTRFLSYVGTKNPHYNIQRTFVKWIQTMFFFVTEAATGFASMC